MRRLATVALAAGLALPAAAPGNETICRQTPMCTLTFVETLAAAPFPYDGPDATTGRAFFDTVDAATGQPAHTTADGLVYPRRPHYGDAGVLFHVPPQFRADRAAVIVVFFHHHMTRLPEAVGRDTAVIEQVNRSGRNAVLIAPQLAVAAYDSAAGNLFRPGGLAALLDEAAGVLAARLDTHTDRFADAPVVLAAYSGGYRALAYSLDRGGVGGRLAGVLLLDGIYDQAELFFDHLAAADRRSWFQAIYTAQSAQRTEAVRDRLAAAGLTVHRGWAASLAPGVTAFRRVATPHRAVPIAGPPAYPLAAALAAWDPG